MCILLVMFLWENPTNTALSIEVHKGYPQLPLEGNMLTGQFRSVEIMASSFPMALLYFYKKN